MISIHTPLKFPDSYYQQREQEELAEIEEAYDLNRQAQEEEWDELWRAFGRTAA